MTQIKGHAVTSLTRTAGDLARWLAYADAVALLDAALRRGVDRAELELERALAARRPGNMRARRALAFADPRAESPGESKSRVLLAELGLPTPVLQQEFRDADGELDARTDFDWPDFGTCGEYDGKDKYGRLLRPGQDIKAAVMYEKRREGVLRDHGRWTIRWGVDELNDPAQFRRIVTTGLEFGLGSRRTG